MNELKINDPIFSEAVDAIDTGQITRLQKLLESNPTLISKRLDTPADGYFRHPYLLWFIADNPIRNGRLPANILEIASLLIQYARQHAPEELEKQLDYALGLVETGRIPHECGVQIQLMDLLIENGATPGDAHDALTHGNLEAAKHLVQITGRMNLTAAVCFDQTADVKKMVSTATSEEKQVALMAAAFYGKPDMLTLLLESGADVNGYIKGGFHHHASPLHQAVSSCSVDAVKLLVEAGANLNAIDHVYEGTPLDWAIYLRKEESEEADRQKLEGIEEYLRHEGMKH